MKTIKLITTSILVCFALQLSAQIRSGVKVPKDVKNTTKVNIPKPNVNLLKNELNYYKIEYNTKNNKRCYSTYTTLNVVDNKGQGFVGYSNSQIELKRNGMLLNRMRFTGNGSTRITARTNYLDVAIYPKSDLHATIDKDNILVTYWGGSDSREFKLQNVKIIRSKTNILITGSIKVRDTSFGISISILEGDCLI